MRTEKEILHKIEEIKEVKESHQKKYIASTDEEERTLIAMDNTACSQEIKLLEWVLKQ